ncbi:putative beta-xylosidase [Colletotrichum viniferum]|nr:putative beta-xylosidase [Colletotrichum viniferum]
MKLLQLASAVLAATMAVAQTFDNPVICEDLADIEVIRVSDTYYYTASTMHYSPGAPVLKSYDLINWEFIGHSVPELTFGEKYYLNSTERAYVGGIWASSLQYRKSNGLFYWYGCIDFSKTYIFTASDPAGEWQSHPPLDECFYDLGVLVDDDDTMYIAYGKYNISVAQMSADGLQPVRREEVWTDATRYLEGSRFYHINGNYYIWFYMGFIDAYPTGRIRALAPLSWDEEGWPHIVTDEAGGWGKTYPLPVTTDKTVNPVGEVVDNFDGSKLGPEWEWNHNPDNTAWELGTDGLTLHTATVTYDLYSARNTLTHRILGPKSSGTFRLNLANMADGDITGVSILRDESAYIGLQREGDSIKLFAVHGILAPERTGWQTTSNGTVVATAEIDLTTIATGAGDIWLRTTADVTPSFWVAENTNAAQFSYSTDGETFTQLGDSWHLHNRWQYFMAFRFAVQNFATKSLGGSVLVKEFSLKSVE